MTTTIFGRAANASRTSAGSPWRHVDASLACAVLAISALGTLMVYSASRVRLAEAGGDPAYFLKRQLLFVAIGAVLMVGVTLVDYRTIRDHASLLYVGTVALLVLVLSPLGSANRGQQASFDLGPFQVQPSEYAKVLLIVVLAAAIAQRRGALDLRGLAGILALAGIPMGLVLLEGDLGTTMVFMVVLLFVLIVGGARGLHLAVLGVLGILAVAVILQAGVLKDYQKARLGAFVNPSADTQASAYNLDQSKTAIGSGGLTGRGLFRGSQTNLSYVPEQHTDFIFTAVGEQLGLVGSATLLGLFAFVMWRIWRAAALARDQSGTVICVGVLAMLLFQVFESVGMTMGIMPITGIPLPFMSYGGSSVLASFLGIGLVLNVHMRRFR